MKSTAARIFYSTTFFLLTFSAWSQTVTTIATGMDGPPRDEVWTRRSLVICRGGLALADQTPLAKWCLSLAPLSTAAPRRPSRESRRTAIVPSSYPACPRQ